MTTLPLDRIRLKPAQMKAIEKRASFAGTTVPDYVRLLIERDLLASRTFDEILKPIRRDIQKSSLTEAQLDAIVARARKKTAPKPRRQG